MTARAMRAFKIKPAEQAALDTALPRYIQWRRDWHDDGVRVDHKALAKLRKAARAFHKVLQPILAAAPTDGTRARLLCRMQEHHLFRSAQSDYYNDLVAGMVTALVIDGACAREVRVGTKADPLAHTWVWIAADAWAEAGGRPSKKGRFADALQAFHRRELPPVGEAQLADALVAWRASRRGVQLQTASPPSTS